MPGSPLLASPTTPAEFLAMERAASSKHQLWDGEVFAMAGASLAHNLLVANLVRLLGNLLVDGPCIVLPSDIKVFVPATQGYVYPDVCVVCGPVVFHDDQTDVIVNPAVVVEVLSESTERFDRGEQFAGYRSLPSVDDYVLVDQTKARVEHYARQDDGSWVLRELAITGTLGLQAITGTIAISEVYRKVELGVPG